MPDIPVRKIPPDVLRTMKSELSLKTRRDPSRIERIMEKMVKVWKQNKDFRFGQLVENIIGSSMMKEKMIKMFFLEDDDFEKMVDTYLAK